MREHGSLCPKARELAMRPEQRSNCFGPFLREQQFSLPMEALQKPEIILTHERRMFCVGVSSQASGRAIQFAIHPLLPTTCLLAESAMVEHAAWVSDLSMEPRLIALVGWWSIIIPAPSAQARPLSFDVKECAASLAYQLVQQHGLGNEQLDTLEH